MQYIIYDLGDQKKGSVAEIQLSAATNVRLIDKLNLDYMKTGHDYTYFGGYVSVSPYRITVPESKHWYVLIDLVGQVKHSVAVRPPQLPDA